MITVDPVADAVRHQLGLKIALPALVSRISVAGQETSNLVSITAQDASAAQAARLATAFATQSQAYRKQVALRADPTSTCDLRSRSVGQGRAGSPVAVRVQELQAGRLRPAASTTVPMPSPPRSATRPFSSSRRRKPACSRSAAFPPTRCRRCSAIHCPTVLFPYARETVADATMRAGFPPVHLAPINFESLYQQQLAQASSEAPAVTN